MAWFYPRYSFRAKTITRTRSCDVPRRFTFKWFPLIKLRILANEHVVGSFCQYCLANSVSNKLLQLAYFFIDLIWHSPMHMIKSQSNECKELQICLKPILVLGIITMNRLPQDIERKRSNWRVWTGMHKKERERLCNCNSIDCSASWFVKAIIIYIIAGFFAGEE